MSNKDKNILKEPQAVYETQKVADEQEMHPVLLQLIEKSIKNHDEGNVFSHEEVMQRFRERFYDKK